MGKVYNINCIDAFKVDIWGGIMMANAKNPRFLAPKKYRRTSNIWIDTKKSISKNNIRFSGSIGSKIIIGLPDDTPIFRTNIKELTELKGG